MEHTRSPAIDLTVSKALSLFEYLAKSDTPLGITQLSRMSGFHKSNVHRSLQTMTRLGYVIQDKETKKYRPSLKIWEIGLSVVRRDLLRIASRPFLMELVQQTSLSAFVAILSGVEMVYLDALEPAIPTGIAPVGSRSKAILASSGKAVLASQPNSEGVVDAVLANPLTGVSLDRQALLMEFEEIREKGFAVTIGAVRRGRNSIAAAISRGDKPPIAAVGVGAAGDRITPDNIADYAMVVIDAAARIGEIARSYESSLAQ
ncbi:IclR family transcriptional regulator [Sphingobium ummariense]